MDLGSVSLAEHAPAKINLALHVIGRRPDGFHLIESLAVFTRHGDRLTVTAAAEDIFLASGPFGSEIPLDGGNLVIRARDALRASFSGNTGNPTALILEKNLPVASGIGGGSADAAAALRALARHWRIGADAGLLSRLAFPLGADIPMCLASRPLIARGIGEMVEPLAGFPAMHMVLVNPGIPVPTPDVFRALACRENPSLPPLPLPIRPSPLPSPREGRGVGFASVATNSLLPVDQREKDGATEWMSPSPRPSRGKGEGQLAFGDICGWLTSTRNDLQAPVVSIAPVILEAVEALTSVGAGFARMSGSGATCFGLFETLDQAKRASAEIRRRQPEWWVVATESIPSKDNPDEAA